jgi:hypothetical protein
MITGRPSATRMFAARGTGAEPTSVQDRDFAPYRVEEVRVDLFRGQFVESATVHSERERHGTVG